MACALTRNGICDATTQELIGLKAIYRGYAEKLGKGINIWGIV